MPVIQQSFEDWHAALFQRRGGGCHATTTSRLPTQIWVLMHAIWFNAKYERMGWGMLHWIGPQHMPWVRIHSFASQLL